MKITPDELAIIIPIITPVIDTWVKPKLEELRKKHKFEKNFNQFATENLTEYLRRSYKKQQTMNTIVFKNQQKRIEQLYIPLSVKSSTSDEIIEKNIQTLNNPTFRSNNYTLIVDNAGMGKSTLMKWLFLSVIKENLAIPLFIELRKLGSSYTILDYITEELNGINNTLEKDYICHLLDIGNFIFFFDGFDEINRVSKEFVTNDLQNFISKCSNNKFIISSREEAALSSFGQFSKYSIMPLSKKDAFRLIKKYDNNSSLSQELIHKLNNEKNLRLLSEFLTNPLLVSLLYMAYEYKRDIPYKKHIFYRQVYHALYDEHDLSKGGHFIHEKKSQLDIEDFQLILRGFAFLCVVNGDNYYEKDDLVRIINQVKSVNKEIEFKANDFIEDITKNVPLLIRDGIEYRWVHKSFQEYFAAHYIKIDAATKKTEILTGILNNSKEFTYYNLLDFYYDIDIKGFKFVFHKFLAENLINLYEEHSKEIMELYESGVSETSLNFRLSHMQLRSTYMFCNIPDRALKKGDLFHYCHNVLMSEVEGFKLKSGTLGYHFSESIDCYIIMQNSLDSNLLNLLVQKQDKVLLSTYEFTQNDEINTQSFLSELPQSKRFFLLDINPTNPIVDLYEFNKINYFISQKLLFSPRDDSNHNAYIDINKCKMLMKEKEESDLILEFKIK